VIRVPGWVMILVLVLLAVESAVLLPLIGSDNYEQLPRTHFAANLNAILIVFGVSIGGLRKMALTVRSAITGKGKTPVPPLNAAFLFYLFLDDKNCDALVGDLEERYKLILNKFGPRKAYFWYWTQALRSVMPIVWAWTKKAAVKPVIGIVAWAVGKGLVGHDSWLAAVAEIWKRIRS
jgi:hypothetical protein